MPRPNFVQYHQYVLESDPIAYWLQDEKQGAVSYDWVRRRQGSDQDGAYTGTTPGRPGMGDGRTSQEFDGANDFNNVFTATFQGRFNGSEGTIAAWARVNGAGVWLDGVQRFIAHFRVDGNNRVYISKHSVNNQLLFIYSAGGVVEVLTPPLTTTNWFHVAITWSASAGVNGEVRAYVNGVQAGATAVALGAWVGNIINGVTNVGANSTVPTNVWHGYIAHAAPWDRPLPPNEINELYRAAAYVPR